MSASHPSQGVYPEWPLSPTPYVVTTDEQLMDLVCGDPRSWLHRNTTPNDIGCLMRSLVCAPKCFIAVVSRATSLFRIDLFAPTVWTPCPELNPIRDSLEALVFTGDHSLVATTTARRPRYPGAHEYHPSVGDWGFFPAGPWYTDHEATNTGGSIVVCGGLDLDAGRYPLSVLVLPPGQSEWRPAADMLAGRTSFGLAPTATGVVVVGNLIDGVECFDLGENRWTKTAAECSFVPNHTVSDDFSGMSLTAVGGAHYSCGGWSFGSMDDVARLDLRVSSWQRVSSLPSTRYEHRAFAFDNTLVCVGGSDHCGRTDLYDVRADRWYTNSNWDVATNIRVSGAVAY